MTTTATDVVRLRGINCEKCGEHWTEPVRRGVPPKQCPSCNPEGAALREIKRRRAQGKPKPPKPSVFATTSVVPAHLLSAVASSVRQSTAYLEPSREDLAREVRALAGAVGPLETRKQLRRLAGLCLAWDSWLDESTAMERTMSPPVPLAHGLYTRDGKRIKEWAGKVVVNQDTGEPMLDPPIRLGRGEVVYLWFKGELFAQFGDSGVHVPREFTVVSDD